MIFDLDALPRLLGAMIHPNNRGYAHLCPKPIHRVLANAVRGMDVDHINGDKLDNRAVNLRVVTHRANCQNRTKLNRNNTSGVTGVYWRARINSWQVYVAVDGRERHLGYFKNKDAAIAKRKAAEHEFYGITS